MYSLVGEVMHGSAWECAGRDPLTLTPTSSLSLLCSPGQTPSATRPGSLSLTSLLLPLEVPTSFLPEPLLRTCGSSSKAMSIDIILIRPGTPNINALFKEDTVQVTFSEPQVMKEEMSRKHSPGENRTRRE